MPRESRTSVLYRCSERHNFSLEDFTAEARSLFQGIDLSCGFIRSGRFIPEPVKDTISSYRLLGSFRSHDGGGHIDVLYIKLAPGASTESSATKLERFAADYIDKNRAEAVYCAAAPAQNGSCDKFLMASPRFGGQCIPKDVIDCLCETAIKEYLCKKCGLSRAALNGYLSKSAILFDDSPIAMNAARIDSALAEVRFCDPASAGGAVAFAMADKIADLRYGLNKYLGSPAARKREKLSEHFMRSSMTLADASAGAISLLKALFRLKFTDFEPSEERLVWGSVIIDRIFDDRKFDIIVTNPPHLRGAQLTPIRELLSGYSSSRFNSDIYCYYIEKSFSLLSAEGAMAALVSDRWMSSSYGRGLRDFFAVEKPAMIMRLGSLARSGGTALPLCIISMVRDSSEPTRYVDLSDRPEGLELSSYAEEAAGDENSKSEANPRLSVNAAAEAITASVSQNSDTLFEYTGGKIFRGILTGLNKAFVIDDSDAIALAAREPASASLLVPFFSGRDIKRFSIPDVKKKLVFMPKGYTNDQRGMEDGYLWFAATHPALASRLARFESEAAKRRDRGDYWWELRSSKNYGLFEEETIVLPIITRRLSAAKSKGGSYYSDKCSIVGNGDYFILGLLNSKLLDFIARHKAPSILNGYFEMRPGMIEKLPIAKIGNSAVQSKLKNEIAACAKKLEELYTDRPVKRYSSPSEEARAMERELDRAVYRLYRLTHEEISAVENF